MDWPRKSAKSMHAPRYPFSGILITAFIGLQSLSLQSFAGALKCSDLFSEQGLLTSVQPLLSQKVQIHTEPSMALRDPVVERARSLKIYDDFKQLADLSPRILSPSRRIEIKSQAKNIERLKGPRQATQFLIESLYEHKDELIPVSHQEVGPLWTLKDETHRPTFDHIEQMWSVLVRQTPVQTKSSLIPLPHPILIPGARFQEGYYWDSFFVFPTLLRSGRESLVRGQIENFLFLLENYGLIPNGNRDYYLSRSQPPMISQMLRLFIEHEMKKGQLSPETLQWIKDKAFPLVKKDYENFWMNPKTRYDAATGLNHHSDSLNTPRPERHSSDREEDIGKTYRDVRAEAESGKDFTDAFAGEAGQYAGVMLNSILYQVERDLSWMAQMTGRPEEAQKFERASQKRKTAMNKYLWDSQTGTFRDYNLRSRQQSDIITADVFLSLYVGLASPQQAQKIVGQIDKLERDGGLMSSEKNSGKQWDAPYGWAPHHFFAISGLMNYGYKNSAQRLAGKWVQTVDNIYRATGKIIEKIDAVHDGVPQETGDKYPTQDGFLWTNGVYAWALTDILGFKPVPK